MAKGVRLKLDPKKVARAAGSELKGNMGMAVIFLRDKVKEKLNRGQPTRTTEGGTIRGLSPSAPGEPPKKVTGLYQNSIITDVVERGGVITGLVGTNQKRGPALEFGNAKGTLAPRPHFRPALRENARRLLSILAKGSKG